jgi:hypothetical protein
VVKKMRQRPMLRPLNRKNGDDTENGGASSVESISPNLISSNASKQTDPFIADRATSTNPPVGGRRRKRPPSFPS